MAVKKKQDFESRLARLTEIVETLEREDAPLEKGMALYKEGVELVKACREQLEKAKYEVSVFSQGEARPLEPVEKDGEDEQNSAGDAESRE